MCVCPKAQTVFSLRLLPPPVAWKPQNPLEDAVLSKADRQFWHSRSPLARTFPPKPKLAVRSLHWTPAVVKKCTYLIQSLFTGSVFWLGLVNSRNSILTMRIQYSSPTSLGVQSVGGKKILKSPSPSKTAGLQTSSNFWPDFFQIPPSGRFILRPAVLNFLSWHLATDYPPRGATSLYEHSDKSSLLSPVFKPCLKKKPLFFCLSHCLGFWLEPEQLCPKPFLPSACQWPFLLCETHYLQFCTILLVA